MLTHNDSPSNTRHGRIARASLALVLGTMAAATAAHAQQLIDVKVRAAADSVTVFGEAAVLGTASDSWNVFNYTSSVPNNAALVDSSGVATSVLLTMSHNQGVGGIAPSGSSPSFLFNPGVYQNPASSPATAFFTVTLSGLEASTDYEFVGFSSNGAGAGGIWSVSIGTAGSGTFANSGDSVSVTSGLGVSYVDFTVTSDASGTISLRNTAEDGLRNVMQGFQIEKVVAVPEPATWAALTGLAALGLAFWRRRT